MKIRHTFIIIVGILCLYSCKKDSSLIQNTDNSNNLTLNALNANSLIGKWNIVTDSTYTGVGQYNHPLNYVGQAADYFDVKTNGTIYIKEALILDTLSYTLKSDTAIVVQSFGGVFNGVPAVSHLTVDAHSAIIASPQFITPGGVFWRKITLSR